MRRDLDRRASRAKNPVERAALRVAYYAVNQLISKYLDLKVADVGNDSDPMESQSETILRTEIERAAQRMMEQA